MRIYYESVFYPTLIIQFWLVWMDILHVLVCEYSFAPNIEYFLCRLDFGELFPLPPFPENVLGGPRGHFFIWTDDSYLPLLSS